MASLRSAGLLLIFVGAQFVALLLAFPFRSAGYATTSNPNSPYDPLPFLVLIVVAPLIILFVARRKGGLATLRWLILLVIAVSLWITLSATIALLLPSPVYAAPVGAGFAFDWSTPLAGAVAVALALALLVDPQWWVVDTAGFVAAGSLIAILGISFGILPAFLLLGGLAIYDAIAVYWTGHMVSLADAVTEMRLPILLVMPTKAGYDYPASGTFRAQRNIPSEEREAMFMGLGDVVIPGTLVVSSFVFLPVTPALVGIGANLVVALAVLAGALVGYAGLMVRVLRGNAQAGLPFLNGGAMAGYVVAYLLLFHSYGLGFQV